jgi:hypothetical protein
VTDDEPDFFAMLERFEPAPRAGKGTPGALRGVRGAEVIDAARSYLQRGWRVVPIPFRSKKPVLKGWQALRLDEADLAQHFNGQPQNLGLLLGEPSAGLVDVDLDCREAVAAAPEFLPSTGLVSGRTGKRRSHYWYIAEPIPKKTQKFRDPILSRVTDEAADEEDDEDATKSMLVELRSTGAQTVIAPSEYPGGGEYLWDEDGDPADVGASALSTAVGRLAACALLSRYWPPLGTRHDAALAAGGFLLRGGLDVDTAARIVETAAKVAGAEGWQQRGRDVRDTADRMHAGVVVTGGPTLAELLPEGKRVIKALRAWLGFTAGDATAAHLTDTGNAARFVNGHGTDCRFVYAWQTWLVFDGTSWRRDAGDTVVGKAKETARSL